MRVVSNNIEGVRANTRALLDTLRAELDSIEDIILSDTEFKLPISEEQLENAGLHQIDAKVALDGLAHHFRNMRRNLVENNCRHLNFTNDGDNFRCSDCGIVVSVSNIQEFLFSEEG